MFQQIFWRNRYSVKTFLLSSTFFFRTKIFLDQLYSIHNIKKAKEQFTSWYYNFQIRFISTYMAKFRGSFYLVGWLSCFIFNTSKYLQGVPFPNAFSPSSNSWQHVLVKSVHFLQKEKSGSTALTLLHATGRHSAVKHWVAPFLQKHLEHGLSCHSSPSRNIWPSKEQDSERHLRHSVFPFSAFL